MRSPYTSNATQSKREAYLKASVSFYDLASVQAEAGELEEAASLILKGLDQERRAGSVGPQVLQLIKPRM